MPYRAPTVSESVGRCASDLELRARMLRTYRWMGCDDVTGPTTWLLLWRHLFALWLGHTQAVPRFQLKADGTPRPAMEDVIAAWDSVHPRYRNDKIVDDWDLALWMFTPSPLLEGQPPYRLVRLSPRKVVDAAAKSADFV